MSCPRTPHCGGRRVDLVGLPHSRTIFLPRGLHLDHAQTCDGQCVGDGRPVGAGAFHRGEDLALGVAPDPGDGPVHSLNRDREDLAALPGPGTGVDDGVGVGLCVGVDSDDVVVFFCDDGHDGFASFTGW